MAISTQTESPDGAMAAGSRIGSYEIVRLIGQGGMSEVYEAIQAGTGRPIALKLLQGTRAEDPRFVERLQREGYALARIRHPNVVIVYDAGVTDGQAWIAMDLLEGQSLRELLVERGRLPIPQALSFGAAICDGLEAAHRLGIVHRDMKPENVFATLDGGLKIVDFGNAKLLNSRLKSTDPHKVFGTAAYMSPEQLGFRRRVSGRSDLYAVGMMLYEILAGHHPFAESAEQFDLPPCLELCRLQIEEMPTPLHVAQPRMPRFISDFVAQMVNKNPDNRPASAFECAQQLRAMHDFVLREARKPSFQPAAIVSETWPQLVSPRGGTLRVVTEPMEGPPPGLRAAQAPWNGTAPVQGNTAAPEAASEARQAPSSEQQPSVEARRRKQAASPFQSSLLAVGLGAALGVTVFATVTWQREAKVGEASASAPPLSTERQQAQAALKQTASVPASRQTPAPREQQTATSAGSAPVPASALAEPPRVSKPTPPSGTHSTPAPVAAAVRAPEQSSELQETSSAVVTQSGPRERRLRRQEPRSKPVRSPTTDSAEAPAPDDVTSSTPNNPPARDRFAPIF